MRTKDFIKMLQEADPSGNGFIRMSGGIPIFADAKEGYYDGSYSYLDSDGNYVTSTEGYKVDIHTQSLGDFVEYHVERNKNMTWEEMKAKIIFKFTTGNSQSRIDSILKEAKETFDDTVDMYKEMFDASKKRSIMNSQLGWKWFQNKLVDTKGGEHHYYTWKIFDENGNSESSNIYNVEGVKDSGLFERVDNNVLQGYYQWIIKK